MRTLSAPKVEIKRLETHENDRFPNQEPDHQQSFDYRNLRLFSRLVLCLIDREGLANDWSLNHAGPNETDWNFPIDNFSVFHDANPLQILFELSTGNSRRFASVTAEILRLSTLRKTVSHGRLVFAISFVLSSEFGSFVLLQRTHGNSFTSRESIEIGEIHFSKIKPRSVMTPPSHFKSDEANLPEW